MHIHGKYKMSAAVINMLDRPICLICSLALRWTFILSGNNHAYKIIRYFRDLIGGGSSIAQNESSAIDLHALIKSRFILSLSRQTP